MDNKELVWDCVEYKTIWEAENAVGFPVLVPAVLGTEHIRRIAVIDKELIDICYSNDIVYRTSKGVEDVSGDYRVFDEQRQFEVDGDKVYHVTAKGFYGRIFLAIWNDGYYTYSIDVPHGISEDSLILLIKSLTQTDSCGLTANASKPNPMAEYHYIFEAEYAAGFGIAVPRVLGTENIEHIYVISGKVVELDYKNDIVYRTARGDEDISGIYETYPHVETFENGRFHVTVMGNADLYYKALWTGCGMTWSLYCAHGIHKESLAALINSMTQVNSCAPAEDAGVTSHAIHGAYSDYHAVTEAETAIFYDTMHLKGVDYEPLLAAAQLVSGKNYRFVCNAKAAVLGTAPYLARVTIYVPLPYAKLKNPILTEIKRLD